MTNVYFKWNSTISYNFCNILYSTIKKIHDLHLKIMFVKFEHYYFRNVCVRVLQVMAYTLIKANKMYI